MKNFPLEKNLLFLGDKSRFIFAKNLVGILPTDCESYELRLEHNESPTDKIQRQENFLLVSSFRTPPGIKIFLPKADDETWQSEHGNFSRLVIFEEFPFVKDSTRQLTEAWLALPKNRPPLSLVIMNLLHRQGSTDIDRLDDAIAEAERKYRAQGLEVILFNSPDDAINILHRHESLIVKHKKILSHELEAVHDRMYELDFLCDDFVADCNDASGCLSLSAVNAICSFESVKASGKNNVWAAYNDAALRRLFPAARTGGTLNELAEIFDYIIFGDGRKTSVCGAANQKLDFLDQLKKFFLSSMTARNFYVEVNPYELRNALAYKKLTSEKNGRLYGINAEYGRRLRKFVEEDAKNFLQSALENYVKYFEKVIL